jgi:SAM-dependent methyltransferase
MLHNALKLAPVRHAARFAADWVDLQWCQTVETLTSFAPYAKGRLLDVGCGDKPYEHIFRPYVTEYIGLEHEATFADSDSASRGKADVLYDGGRMPFDDQSFDTVLNVQVLEHTPTPGELVKEIARVLKPTGVALLTAPFSFRLHEEPHDYFRYSPHGLRQLCAAAGLEVVEVRAQGGLWSVLGHKLNSYLALRVARLSQLAQGMGKLGHEGSSRERVRWWAVPVVAPSMIAISTSARVLDRFLHDPTEALGFAVVARHAARPAG